MERFWVPHQEHVWIPGWLHHTTDDQAILATESGETVQLPVAQLSGLAKVTEREVQGVEDICTLDHVGEGTLLHTVRERYFRKLIYTNVSQILIAVNPFEALPLFSAEVLDRYRDAVAGERGLPPHIFAIGANAMNGLRRGDRDQAILISGESGAGKTESAKLVMSYVSEATRSDGSSSGGLEEKVLRSNPVLEAFGNAMTVRNNNSSRFGKWLDFKFGVSGAMLGCRITHYLLEVTRVCSQSPGERSYHIFFQLLQAREDEMFRDLRLKEPRAYRYLQGGALTVPSMSDADGFHETREALSAIGFEEESQAEIFRIVAAVLVLGDCRFEADGGDRLKIADEEAAKHAAELLGLDAEELSRCMLFRKIVVGKETTFTPMRLEQANAVRDGLSRMLYGLLFTWLVRRINTVLQPSVAAAGSVNNEPSQFFAGGDEGRLLGILDIAGFESFDHNSLEQLLINLSNEHLQQHFNYQVFTAELEDYAREGLDLGKNSAFEDNADCLALLDGKGGILEMLDEELALPNATDETFAKSVLNSHAKHVRLVPPKFSGKPVFGIKHYAGAVNYNCSGFLAKNADRPPDNAMALLSSSRRKLVQELGELMAEEESAEPAKAGAKKKPKSSTSKFRLSLRSLMGKIGAADPHFIRCIKPNKAKVPGIFTSTMVKEQLLLSGVLEAVKIRQRGYPSRVPHRAFVCRYGFLLSSFCKQDSGRASQRVALPEVKLGDAEAEAASAKAVAISLLERFELEPGQLILGKTKVFMKAHALSVLEELLSRGHARVATLGQALFRGSQARKKLALAKPTIDKLQDWLRRNCGRSEAEARSCGGSCSMIEVLGSVEAAEKALAELEGLLGQAQDLPVGAFAVALARAAQQRLQAEIAADAQIRSLVTSVDPLAISKALARARDVGLTDGPLAVKLGKRAEALKVQLPLIEALQKALAASDAPQCQAAVDAVAAAGLAERKEEWLAELPPAAQLLEGAARLAEAARAKAEAEAKDREAKARVAEERRANEQKASQLPQPQPQQQRQPQTQQASQQETAPSGAPSAPSREKRRPTVTGFTPDAQAQLLQSLEQAADEYEAVALEHLLAEAIRNGVDSKDVAGPQKVLMQLQQEAFLFAAVEKARDEADTPQPSLTVLRRLQNLSNQIRVLQGNEEVARGALSAAQHGARRRSSTSRRMSAVLDAPSAADFAVAESAFRDLREYGKLKQQKSWKGHRGSQLLRLNFDKPTDRENMLGHSKVAIAEALTNVRKVNEALAVQSFRNVLFWMGDKPAQECQRLAAKEAVLNASRSDSGMRDEIYVQVIKQLHHNPSPRSALLGWQLLLCLCQDSAPSHELLEFVRYFASEAAPLPVPHARERLTSETKAVRESLGAEAASIARACLAALAEVGAGDVGAVVADEGAGGTVVCDVAGVVVHLIDGSTQTLCVPVATSLRHLGALLSLRLGLKRSNDFGFFQLIDGVDAPRFLPEHVKVAELCSRWQQLREATGLQANLHWWRRFTQKEEALLASDPVHAALTFHQALEQHLRRPILWSEEEQLVRIAAAILCVRFDCATSRMRDRDFLENLLPAQAMRDLTPKKQDLLRGLILEEVKNLRLKVGPTQPSLRRMSETFGLLQEICLFGSYHWPAQQVLAPPGAQTAVVNAPERVLRVHKSELEREVWIFVNMKGVHLLPVKGGLSRSGEPKKSHSSKLWTFTYRASTDASAEGQRKDTESSCRSFESKKSRAWLTDRLVRGGSAPCCGRLLRWGALPGVLQLVVQAVDPDRPREGLTTLTITLTCPQAMDAAFAVHTALTDLTGGRSGGAGVGAEAADPGQ